MNRYGRVVNGGFEKSMMCEQKGIRLIHIYSDEWECNNIAIKRFLIDTIENKQYQHTSQFISLPSDKYPIFYQIEGYKLIGITQPKTIYHQNIKGKGYHAFDCGQLIYEKIDLSQSK